MSEGDGPRYDAARAERACAVIERGLVHTKGIYARRPFVLRDWQRTIVEDLFGTVRWDDQYERWVRLYRLGWLELGRGNGKSELLAAIALVLLCADDEEQAEVYGCAKDREQAGAVYEVAKRMVELGPLSKRLKIVDSRKQLIDPKTGSVYRVIAADAAGNLGQNPHGIIFDEVITQPSRALWDALKTGMGKRTQPLMIAGTTAGNDPGSFAMTEHRFSERVAEDPSLDPTRYVVMRNTPDDADPWDEAVWYDANPALGDFLSIATLRDEAREAQENPAAESVFRQFRLNQWVSTKTRWIATHVWDEQAGKPVHDWNAYRERRCWGGLDLGAVSDMTAFVLVFPPTGDTCPDCGVSVSDETRTEHVRVYRKFWVPQAQVDADPTGLIARFAARRQITVTPGSVTDYRQVVKEISADVERFAVESVALDYAFQGISVAQALQEEGVRVTRFRSGYRGFAEPTVQFERRVLHRGFHHGGDAVLRWQAGNVVVARNSLGYTMPAKDKSTDKVDGIVAAIMAVGEMVGDVKHTSAYEDRGLTLA